MLQKTPKFHLKYFIVTKYCYRIIKYESKLRQNNNTRPEQNKNFLLRIEVES